ACAPSPAIDSGSTALTVALVPTAMNAGVWMVPCGVVMVPVRPRKVPPLASIKASDGEHVSARRWPTEKENPDCREERPGKAVDGGDEGRKAEAGTLPSVPALPRVTCGTRPRSCSSQPSSYPRRT